MEELEGGRGGIGTVELLLGIGGNEESVLELGLEARFPEDKLAEGPELRFSQGLGGEGMEEITKG